MSLLTFLFFFIDDDDLFDEDSIVKTTSSKGASNVVDVEENDNEWVVCRTLSILRIMFVDNYLCVVNFVFVLLTLYYVCGQLL